MTAKHLRATVMVATHKKYRMPEDPLYLPLHVGAEGKVDADGNPLDFGYQKDNTGDNISIKNPKFCELTAFYWAWKNLDADFIGLVHYRRYFGYGKKQKDPFRSILTDKQLQPMLRKYDVFVPAPQRYIIETLYSHYEHTHYAEHLDVTREVIRELYPTYLSTYDKVIKNRYGYMFNMMIMKRSLFDKYMDWIFNIMNEVENRIDDSQFEPFEARFYGRISEIIFNVWLQYQIDHGVIKKSRVKTLPLVYMENINWANKITSFLKAKFLHEKYRGSF